MSSLRLYTCLLSLAIAGVFALSRLGLPLDPLYVLPQALGLTFGLLCIWELLPKRIQSEDASLPVLVPLAAAIVLGYAGLSASGLLTAIGVVSLVQSVRHNRRSLRGCWVFGVGLLGVMLAIRFWGSGAHFPDLFERLGYLWINPDRVLFPGSAKLLDHYGVLTTGIDGLVPIRYHLGSHWTFVQLARLLGVDLLDFYVAVYPVLILPLLVYALSLAACSLGRQKTNPSQQRVVFVFTAVMLLTPPVVRLPLFSSESYTVAILFAALAFAWAAPRLVDGRTSGIVGLPFLLALLTAIKVSTGVTALAGTGWYLLQTPSRLFTKKTRFLTFGICSCAVLLTLKSTLTGGPGSFGFFALLGQSPGWQRYTALPMLFALPIIGTLLAHFLGQGASRNVLLVFCGIGALAVALLDLPDGNQIYFAADATFVAIVILAALTNRIYESFHQWQPNPWASLRFAGIALVVAVGLNSMRASAYEWATQGMRLRMMVYSRANRRAPRNWRELVANTRTDLARDPTTRFFRELRELEGLDPEIRRQTALYFPQTNLGFWNAVECYNAPLVAIALSGIALLDGMPDPGCQVTTLGYHAYPPRSVAGTSSSDAKLCVAAKGRGFRYIFRIDSLAWVSSDPALDCGDLAGLHHSVQLVKMDLH